MSDNEIQCLYCTKRFDHELGIQKNVDLMRKHVKQEHPNKPQI